MDDDLAGRCARIRLELSAIDNLQPGDRISVYTVQGRIYEIEVTEVSADSILAKNRSINRQDIAQVEKRRFSIIKTLGLTAGILIGILIVGLASLDEDDFISD